MYCRPTPKTFARTCGHYIVWRAPSTSMHVNRRLHPLRVHSLPVVFVCLSLICIFFSLIFYFYCRPMHCHCYLRMLCVILSVVLFSHFGYCSSYRLLTYLVISTRVQYNLVLVQQPARSSASVPREIVPTSRRCRITATSSTRHPTAPGRTASPAQLLWPTGFLCGWYVGLEFPAGQLAESDYWWKQFQTIFEDFSVRNVLMHSAH